MNSNTLSEISEDEIAADGFSNFQEIQFELYGRGPEDFSVIPFVTRAITYAMWTVSPLSLISDPWMRERVRRDSQMTVPIYQEIVGRWISRAEAIQIANDIRACAERQRQEFAEFEALRGLSVEDGI